MRNCVHLYSLNQALVITDVQTCSLMGCQIYICMKGGEICNCHITIIKSMLNTATMEKPGDRTSVHGTRRFNC